MAQRHLASVFDFLILPIKLASVAVFKPRSLSELSIAEKGVVYSLVAAFWTIVTQSLLERQFAEELGTPAVGEVLDVVLSVPFAFEILTIPKLIFFVFVFWMPAFLVFRNHEDRSNMISFSLILFFLASLPIMILSRTPIYPESLWFREASSDALLQGNLGVWIFLMVPVLIGSILYPLNAREVAPNSSTWGLASYFILVVLTVVFFSWEVEWIVDSFSLNTFYFAIVCEDTGCFTQAVGRVLDVLWAELQNR